jgi:hypothetical protein
MMDKNFKFLVLIISVALLTIGLGCSYTIPIQYSLAKYNTFKPDSIRTLSVLVTTFSDIRPMEEQAKLMRERTIFTDIDDYTYNKEFNGKTNEGISRMLSKHLKYSKIFKQVEYANLTEDQLNKSIFDSLNSTGVRAVMIGSVTHFYGYYERDVAREWFYSLALAIPAVVAGVQIMKNNPQLLENPLIGDMLGFAVGVPMVMIGQLLENSHSRKIGWHTQLTAKLINTSTYNILWQDSATSYNKELAPGKFSISGNSKFNLAFESLRNVVNEMIKSINMSTLIPN